jgi:hypothetical protein
VPETVGDHVLEERLPHAGGAIVWRARNATGDPVRLQLSDPTGLEPGRAVRAFERLTAALTRWGRQNWPGVEVPVGTVLPDASGRFALATRWTDGAPILEVLPPAGFERLEQAVGVALDVGDALAALHAADAVHGAVAAHNVWRGPGGTTLLGFWWSQANLRDHPGPAAPEAIAAGRFDAKADQWAWGRLLRVLLEHDLDAPGDLEAILTRSTEREPRARYPNMADAVAALRSFERTLRTDDVLGVGGSDTHTLDAEALTEDLGARARPEAPTEDLGQSARDDEPPTEDVTGDPNPTVPTPAPGGSRGARDPAAGSGGGASRAHEPTLAIARPERRARRLAPWLLWAAALGVAVLASALLVRAGDDGRSAPERIGTRE